MSILLTVAVALAVGILLIALVGRGARSAPPAPGLAPPGELEWVRALGADGLERLLLALLSEMGVRTERSARGDGRVDLVAVDPTPIRGGRVHVHGVLGAPGVPLGADDVRMLLDAVRADGAGKALLVTLEGFAEDARAAARDAPIELVDGAALAALVKRHLPQAAATRTV